MTRTFSGEIIVIAVAVRRTIIEQLLKETLKIVAWISGDCSGKLNDHRLDRKLQALPPEGKKWQMKLAGQVGAREIQHRLEVPLEAVRDQIPGPAQHISRGFSHKVSKRRPQGDYFINKSFTVLVSNRSWFRRSEVNMRGNGNNRSPTVQHLPVFLLSDHRVSRPDPDMADFDGDPDATERHRTRRSMK